MNQTPRVSVVIPSRERPDTLALTLAALRTQRFRDFEVIVVSPVRDIATPAIAPFRERIAHVACEDANISRARNLGLQSASGEIVAFLDDDAVPEPGWLLALLDAFDLPDVIGAGGFVIGRNGVSWQWQGISTDKAGDDQPVDADPHADPFVPKLAPGLVLKTIGTNCAFRASTLREIGGFDPNYRYFLDETDVNHRLRQDGGHLALAPRAVVHHSYGPSATRTARRIPRSLLEIGASKSYFCKQFLPPDEAEQACARFRDHQRRRLVVAMRDGWIEPREVTRLLGTLDRGLAAGRGREPSPASLPLPSPLHPGRFAWDAPGTGTRIAILADAQNAAEMATLAAKIAETGAETTLLDFRPGFRFLTVRFCLPGFWHHRGGIQGRGARWESLVSFQPWSTRITRESARVAPQRGFDAVISEKSAPPLTNSKSQFRKVFNGRSLNLHDRYNSCLNFAVFAGFKPV